MAYVWKCFQRIISINLPAILYQIYYIHDSGNRVNSLHSALLSTQSTHCKSLLRAIWHNYFENQWLSNWRSHFIGHKLLASLSSSSLHLVFSPFFHLIHLIYANIWFFTSQDNPKNCIGTSISPRLLLQESWDKQEATNLTAARCT